MIAITNPSRSETQASAIEENLTAGREPLAPIWHDGFLSMLPAIRRYADFRFRKLNATEREEAIQEAIANALVGYLRLVEQGRGEAAYAGPLARYAVRQVRTGRRVGGRLNVRDITSKYCQQRTGVIVERLDCCDETTGDWHEIVVEDRHSTPADIATTRIDFRDWLASLSKRDRRLAEKLAVGESTSFVAHFFGITPGRVSQLRRELFASWQRFQSDLNWAIC